MRFLQPLWLLLTTGKDSDLRQIVEYLREENRILRSKLPAHVTVTARERSRLVKFGSKIGGAIRELITIVSYRTFCRWRADTEPSKDEKKVTKRKPGRPKTKEEIRELILKLARKNNGWGSTHVLGELNKLGIITVGRTTVAESMREAGLDPGPKWGNGAGSYAGIFICGRAGISLFRQSSQLFLENHQPPLWAAVPPTVRRQFTHSSQPNQRTDFREGGRSPHPLLPMSRTGWRGVDQGREVV